MTDSQLPCSAATDDALRNAFIERHHKNLDLTEANDAWGRPIFKHSHIQTLWDGWKEGAEFAVQSSAPAQSTPDLLQEIHDAVNALGGRADQDNSYDQGIVDTVAKVLDIIEPLYASQPSPAAKPTIDDVPSCGQENDFRRALPAVDLGLCSRSLCYCPCREALAKEVERLTRARSVSVAVETDDITDALNARQASINESMARPNSSAANVDVNNRPETPHWERRWQHDQPNGWNRDADKFLALIKSAGGSMWLALGRAKYLEMRIDTRDCGFNLYDRDGKPLNPDDVVKAVEEVKEKYGAAVSYRDEPQAAIKPGSMRAQWTYDEEARAYYFAPMQASAPPYTTREVTAIIDIANDGTLAGVELVEMSAALPSPPLSRPHLARGGK